ncbi:triose-phosphate isomerase [Maricaulis sp. D1M11]|uniref:triose-phosphate isomerase n=1 Tax=Maricaulis sp. D1M11 TaxID=3076117 RepID=UPI0039B5A22C
MSRRVLIAGNWKMNGSSADLDFFQALECRTDVDVLVCLPATLIAKAATLTAQSEIKIGGQDCHAAPKGAHTGDLSAAMLADVGAQYVITGHSERRADHGETDDGVRAKSEAAQAAGLVPVICVGESQDDREAGRHIEIVTAQLAGSLPAEGPFIIAYEPVWAIGTGLTARAEDIAEMHAAIRAALPIGEAVQILYGGSVKPKNAAEILALEDVDGALVGGASLEAESFNAIIASA